MRLTEHFTLEEFLFSQTAVRKGIKNEPDDRVRDNLLKTAQGMEGVRLALGGLPIRISSGYRSPELNRAVGGSKTSAHTLGYAVDFTVAGLSPAQVAQKLATSGLKFDQLIREFDQWVHISFDPKLRQQLLTAKKVNGKTVYEAGV